MKKFVGEAFPPSGNAPIKNVSDTTTDNGFGFGPHLMLDLNDCDPEKLNDYNFCFKLLFDLPDKVNMTRITQPYVFPYSGLIPEDEGITGFVVIAESHISIHTFPKKNYAFIDAFSCKDFEVEKVREYFIDAFKSKDPQTFYVERGLKFPRDTVGKKRGSKDDQAA